jgi:hypothetical protein
VGISPGGGSVEHLRHQRLDHCPGRRRDACRKGLVMRRTVVCQT